MSSVQGVLYLRQENKELRNAMATINTSVQQVAESNFKKELSSLKRIEICKHFRKKNNI